MPTKSYDAIIIHTGDDCTIHFPNETYVLADIKKLFKDQERVTIEVKSRKKIRNIDQNAYLHLCLQMIADETGNSLDAVKTTLKALYAKQPLLYRNGDPIVDKSSGEIAHYIQDTRYMSTVECFEFTEKVIMFARDFCAIVLPQPDENIKLKL